MSNKAMLIADALNAIKPCNDLAQFTKYYEIGKGLVNMLDNLNYHSDLDPRLVTVFTYSRIKVFLDDYDAPLEVFDFDTELPLATEAVLSVWGKTE